jgi:hypothetical protein
MQTRRPPGKSSWTDASEMKANAFFKIAFYKVSVHEDPKKLIKLDLTAPFARHNLKGQQHSVETNRKSEEWLIQELERRTLLNPAFNGWQVAFLIDNRSPGYPAKILRYYENVITGSPMRLTKDQWPQATKRIHDLLTVILTA